MLSRNINDISTVIRKWYNNLERHFRVIIYDRNVLTIQASGVYGPGNHFKPSLIFENVVEVPYGAPLNEVENDCHGEAL